MFQIRSRGISQSEGLDGDVATILLRLLDNAGRFVDRDIIAARTCLDRASALLESERSRVAHRFSELHIGEQRPFLAPWQVKRVTAYVSENIDAPIRIAELAGVAGLTIREFCAAFNRSFGVSVREYIDLRRMNLACIMMLTTDQPLFKIAPSCGFWNQAEFSRCFSKTFGESPKVWRRERRGFSARV